MTKKSNIPTKTVSQPEPSKREQLVKLLARDSGATLDAMIALTGWLPHTVRAALTGLRKEGYVITSDKVEEVRTYRAAAAETA
jgi:predicted ArsR family transcriptional regulator